MTVMTTVNTIADFLHRNKGFVLIFLNTIVLIAILITTASLNINVQISRKNKQSPSIIQSVNTLPQTQSNSMDDHHKPKPVEALTFNTLVGKTAPDFTIESYDGKQITLNSLKGKNVILFFNEGLMCYPACWNQIVAFGKDSKLQSKNTVVLNVVLDPKDKWKEAINKMPELAKALVVFDTNAKVSLAYAVLSLPSSMHRGQLPGHTFVLIDKEGIVRYTKDDEQMAIRNMELIAEIDKL